MIKHSWHQLKKLTGGSPLIIERIRLADRDIAVGGHFELPPLAQLSLEDQVFVIAFIRSHGSLKEMEQLYGISYPTVKNRLKRIAGQLEFVEVTPESSSNEVLELLEKGKISVSEALERMKR
ncbi:MAG: DUF2089 domain-containing protein [Candidatus Aminicenantes bacterium]|nr:DUF2089 domain-containing protein [Candidatus Aminicenantes bacterium]